MILSNVSIHEALDKGWLTITPEPTPRLKTEGGPKCPFQTSALDLRLGPEIAYFKEGIPAQIDLRKGDFNTMFAPLSETRTLTEDQPFVLRPRKLVLGKTLERVEFPLLTDGTVSLAARVEGKSSTEYQFATTASLRDRPVPAGAETSPDPQSVPLCWLMFPSMMP